ncbi:MAG: tetratricopeptide repeat protein, partial [Gammaproteobacteria bacterium]|nr:tetratricopeptide repeat protein [Gammaproteobacteria bacterium]
MSDTFKQAISLHQTGDFVAAEQCYVALLNNNDNDINRKNIHYLLGLLYSQIKQYDKAIYQLEQSLPLNRKNADLYNALAVCHQKKHQIKAAERFINIACKIAPANANYLNRKSKILISSNKLAQSIANASLCISKNPDFFPAYQSYVTACNLLLRPDNGLRLLKKACKLFQGNPEVLFSLAEAYMNTGKHIKAKKIFEDLSQEKYKTIACLNNLGNIEKDYGQTIAAKQYYEQALQLSPDNPATQWNLGLVQLLEGNYTSSWNQYDERLKLYNKSTCLDKVKTWKGENLNNKSII